MIVEQRTRRRTVVIVALLLAVAAVVVLLLFGGGTPRRIVHRPGVHHTILKQAPAARPAVAATNRSEVGAIAAARQYAQSFPTGRHAYGYRVLSFRGHKALVEFVAPETLHGSVQWWVFDAPTVYGTKGWWVNGPWMTLDPPGSPPPPLNAYRQWPN